MRRYVVNANIFVDAENLRSAIAAVKQRFPEGACAIIVTMVPPEREGQPSKVVQYGEDE